MGLFSVLKATSVYGYWIKRIIVLGIGDEIPPGAKLLHIGDIHPPAFYYEIDEFIEHEDNSKETEREDPGDK